MQYNKLIKKKNKGKTHFSPKKVLLGRSLDKTAGDQMDFKKDRC